AQACPRAARGAQTPQWRTRASTRTLRGADELAFDTDKEENLSYRSQTLESVKHHLKPNRQRSVGPRHRMASNDGGLIVWTQAWLRLLRAVESRPDGSAGVVAVDAPLIGDGANNVKAVV